MEPNNATGSALATSAAAVLVNDPEPAGRPIPRDADALLFTAEAAYLCGISSRMLEKLRAACEGPDFVSIGRAVRYFRRDVLAWAAARRRSSTSAGEAA